MWRDSKEFGIAKAQSKSGKWLVVANYSPAGNFLGRYKENVLPPTSGKVELPKKGMPFNSNGENMTWNHQYGAIVSVVALYKSTFDMLKRT